MARLPEFRHLDSEGKEKLTTFLEYFVYFYETFLSGYYERLENQSVKPGKWADFINSVIDTGKDATEGIPTESTKGAVLVSINIFQKITSSIGNKYNRDRLKKLLRHLENFQKDRSNVREVLVEAGIEIFLNFANQFLTITADGVWKRGMQKLAHDCVNRIFHYAREVAGEEEEFSPFFVTKGVIQGKSKKFKDISTNIPHFKRGHTVHFGNSVWNTGKLFKHVGLVYSDRFFTKKNENYKFGYRFLFQWECDDTRQLKKYLKAYHEDMNGVEKIYKYILSADMKEKVLKSFFYELDKKDSKVRRVDENSLNVQAEIEENFKEFEEFINENFQELNYLLQQNCAEIKQLLIGNHDEIKDVTIKHHKELVTKMDEGNTEIMKKLENIEKKVPLRNSGSVEISFPFLFDVRDAVPSFTGRETELEKIAQHHGQHVFVLIAGLVGVGKSELGVKYAHVRHQNGSSVLWINSETQDTAKDSYRNLLKQLSIKTMDKDGVEKSMRHMAQDAYNFFVTNDSLFIFDNAEDSSVVKEILPPKSEKILVLITSQNKKLLDHQRYELIELEKLSENEAVLFVKNALKIKSDDQNESIKKLVKTLGCLPIALQHAVAYIDDSGFVDFLGDYVKLYKQSEREVENILDWKGLKDKTIFLTFRTAIEKVKKEAGGKLAVQILNSMAYFAPDNVAKNIFLKLALDAIDETCVENSINCLRANGDLSRAIHLISKYSLINIRSDQSEQLSLHRLVQQVIIRANTLDHLFDEEKVLEKSLELIKKFISQDNAAGCIPHIKSIWDHACKYENLVKKHIVDESNDKATRTTTYINLIIERCSSQVVKSVIEKINSADMNRVVNAKSKDDLTPLHKAVMRGNGEIVQLLIDIGADVNAQKLDGWCPLHLAAKNGSLEIVLALLSKSADTELKTRKQFTALHIAVQNDEKVIVEALLAANADVNAQTEFQFTPLHLSVLAGNLSMVQTLLNHEKISINAQSNNNIVPLHLAVKWGHLKIVEILLSQNANVNAQNLNGVAPLHYGAIYNRFEIVKKLLESDVIDCEAKTNKGETPLDLASKKGHDDIVQILTQKMND